MFTHNALCFSSSCEASENRTNLKRKRSSTDDEVFCVLLAITAFTLISVFDVFMCS